MILRGNDEYHVKMIISPLASCEHSGHMMIIWNESNWSIRVPELPEVETVVRDLRPCLVDRKFASIRVGRRPLRRRWQRPWSDLIRGRTIQSVERRGKWIVIQLDGPFLVIHLGMTGQLTVVAARRPLPDHTHFIFDLAETDQQLRFRDVRRFGSATCFADRLELNAFFESRRSGPRTLHPGKCLLARLSRKNSSLPQSHSARPECRGRGRQHLCRRVAV